MTALCLAAAKGDTACVRALKEAGANAAVGCSETAFLLTGKATAAATGAGTGAGGATGVGAGAGTVGTGGGAGAVGGAGGVGAVMERNGSGAPFLPIPTLPLRTPLELARKAGHTATAEALLPTP